MSTKSKHIKPKHIEADRNHPRGKPIRYRSEEHAKRDRANNPKGYTLPPRKYSKR